MERVLMSICRFLDPLNRSLLEFISRLDGLMTASIIVLSGKIASFVGFSRALRHKERTTLSIIVWISFFITHLSGLDSWDSWVIFMEIFHALSDTFLICMLLHSLWSSILCVSFVQCFSTFEGSLCVVLLFPRLDPLLTISLCFILVGVISILLI